MSVEMSCHNLAEHILRVTVLVQHQILYLPKKCVGIQNKARGDYHILYSPVRFCILLPDTVSPLLFYINPW